ncbi:gluconate 2-dehydrogenase subunit 3 family protein [Halapricum hydrolyticum]|uniref:Gluconate 2-dehydrogenase subunit 3 family protein n=1 Tax=Halapricum hydrolyticum TaxID=2979991 RepID=A0AAE3LDQ7_9EURY|nr:gluconate 2-dehydrogenase subunit 3 family protein [Halapricum hydrolyticum]MCU4716919.1 gluconate 2-dehydrogenase subunit 3 family protein [Halapricum hydrolyticum]MCU4725476.1 gluconate 2-dehydrogenase subunit 3 family protein [Halapricum hydrolyticum]
MTHETDDRLNRAEDDTETPKLSRRDALVALGAAGVGAAGLGALAWDEFGDEPPEQRGTDDPSGQRETIVAAAEALYPERVSGIDSFVERYVVGRVQDRPAYFDGVRTAARNLDDYARHWYDQPFAALDRGTRQAVFDDYGLADRDPDPDGTERERVRYYLINELLFAFYSSPTGGSLIGLENPPGHPGGIETYQRGPRG